MTQPPEFTGLRALAAKGLLITGAAQAWRVIVGFVSIIVLARLLTPSDFGLFAAASTCLAFVTLIQDLGINQATIQRVSISQAEMSALFWISLLVSACLAASLYFSAGTIASFFGEPRVEPLVMACSILLIFGGAQSQHIALLNRELRFTALAALDVASVSVSVITGLAIAYASPSYWALYAATFAALFTNVVGAWVLSGWLPSRPATVPGHLSDLFRFGAGISGYNILNFFARNADNLLIGRYWGPEQLGFYDRAYRLLLFPIQQLMLPTGRMVFPLLSRLQSDPTRYRQAYCESVSLLMLGTQPALAFAIVFSDSLFLILFGADWLPAAKIFSWLGTAGLLQIANSPTGWLFVSQGRGSDFFFVGLLSSIVTVFSFFAGLHWGAAGVAISYTLSEYFFRLPLTWISAGRKGPVSTFDLVLLAFPHALATLLTMSTLWWISSLIQPPRFLGCIALIVVSYSAYLFILLVFPERRRSLSGHMTTIVRLFYKRRS